MRFLVAISSKEFSKQTLHIGSSIANAFSADLSVVSVRRKPKDMLITSLNLTADTLQAWNILHPGVEMLTWAYRELQALQFIDADAEMFDPADMVEEQGRIRVIVPHSHGSKISLVLREGDVVSELKDETTRGDYLLTIVGGGVKPRLTRQLIQFVDTSIMFVKNFDPEWNYRLLICVDDSDATKKAVAFGANVAKNFNAHVDLVTASKTRRFGPGYSTAAEWARRYLEIRKIPYTQNFRTGDPATVFAEEAGTDHILIMGKSKMHPLKAWIMGTKPGDTVLKAQCPVILVK